jgi:ABC-type phosphate transport system substrate-binding protein
MLNGENHLNSRLLLIFLRRKVANAPGGDSFPIASFTWIYLRTSSSASVRAAEMSDLLDWICTDGQRSGVQEGCSALPAQLLTAVRKKAKTMQ